MSMRSPTNDRYTKEREGGATRSGASSMKPARAAASSVRVESKRKPSSARGKAMAQANMSKEEKRAQRAKERAEEDLLYTASTEILKKDEKYKKLRRWWWVLLVGAVVFTALSWATLSTGVGGDVLSIVILVLAYASIIGALVLDLTVIRKRRNAARDKVQAMSKAAVNKLVEDSYVERTAREEARKARSAARKAKASKEEAEAAYQTTYDSVIAGGKKGIAEREAAIAPAKDSGKGGKSAKAKGKSAEANAGETSVTVVEEAQLTPEEQAEEERKAAAAKAARDFAASRRKS